MQLNFHAYINYTGYSIASQEYIMSMLRCKPDVDIKLTYVNARINEGISANRHQLFKSLAIKKNSSDQINLFHTIPVKYTRPKNSKKNVGICVYETIDPPKEWIASMNQMDAIITASHFNKNTFENSGVKVPIHVIPHCFDSKMFNNSVKPIGRYNLTTFFSMGTWKARKNWDSLIKAWYDAFENRENVCLIIKTDKIHELKQTVLSIKMNSPFRSKDTAPIYCDDSVHCEFENIPSIMRKGDIYISTSLAEGFGLCGMHAMALQMPVIIPRFGGCLEYAKPGTCTYIEPSQYKRIPNMDGIPQFSNKIWPVLNLSDIKKAMRIAYEKRQECAIQSQLAYKYVHDNFSYEKIGPELIKILEI